MRCVVPGVVRPDSQAVTKRIYDAAHTPGKFKVGDWVLVTTVAGNKLLPNIKGSDNKRVINFSWSILPWPPQLQFLQ